MLLKLVLLVINLLLTINLVRRWFKKPTEPTPNTSLGRAEALRILGVDDNASPAEIQESYHRLMKMLHPDNGGSEYFAARLNHARDVLLK